MRLTEKMGKKIQQFPSKCTIQILYHKNKKNEEGGINTYGNYLQSAEIEGNSDGLQYNPDIEQENMRYISMARNLAPVAFK